MRTQLWTLPYFFDFPHIVTAQNSPNCFFERVVGVQVMGALWEEGDRAGKSQCKNLKP
jgi:hypothetical protein